MNWRKKNIHIKERGKRYLLYESIVVICEGWTEVNQNA